jgi:hypothetical protein
MNSPSRDHAPATGGLSPQEAQSPDVFEGYAATYRVTDLDGITTDYADFADAKEAAKEIAFRSPWAVDVELCHRDGSTSVILPLPGEDGE